MTAAEAESLALQFRGFLNTPQIWQDNSAPFPQYDFREFDLPQSLQLKIPPSLPLGRRIEHFFAYYINHYTEQEVLSANVQISSEKITIGELDFLLKDPKGVVTHLELVYKFYIYHPSFASEEERWIGPNRRDSFQRKLKHLREHQFPLLYRKETQDHLDQLNLKSEEIRQQVCFKANLFVPKQLLTEKFPAVNPQCITGYWIRQKEFTAKEFGSSLFFSPKKADWPRDPSKNEEWKTFSEIKEQLQTLLDRKKSPLVWIKKSSGKLERFFIVWW